MPKKITQSALWPETWPVVGTSGTMYTVGRKRDGTWGCDCPAWMFQKKVKWIMREGILQRRDCQHILQKKMEMIHQNGNQSVGKATNKIEEVNSSRVITLDE